MSADNRDRATAVWFERRRGEWGRIETRLPALEDRKPIEYAEVLETIREYPELARDVAIAEQAAPGGSLSRQLQSIYGRVHRSLFRAPRSMRDDFLNLILREAPALTRILRWHIASVTVGFIVAALAGWWLVGTFPELAGLFASETMVETVEKGELWTDDLLNIFPSSLLAVSIFTNNIMVTLTAASLGTLYGLGTIYIIGLNGLMLGGIFAFTARHDLAGRLFEFVVAHGFVELSVICIAGAIGFYIGESIARPGHLSRIQSFRRAFSNGARLLTVCVIFLIGAGLIEGYVSPDPRFSLPVRLFVGLGYWLVFLLTLVGWQNLRPGAGLARSDTERSPGLPDPGV